MPPDSFSGGLGQVWAAFILVGWFVASRRCARIAPFSGWSGIERGAIVYSIAMAGHTSSTILLGRLFGLGYYGSASGGVLLALCIAWLLRRRVETGRRRDGDADRAPDASESPGGWWGLLGLGSLPVLLIAVLTHGVDPGVHHWNMRAIQRDLIPLPHPSYPEVEIPYHYAIDLMAATWGRLIPLDPEWIFDGLSVCAWIVSVVLGARLVVALRPMSRLRALGYAIAFAFLGGGLMWLFFPLAENVGAAGLLRAGLSPSLFKAGLYGHFTTLSRNLVNLPTLHYFFNMPIAAGLPMGLTFLHVHLAWTRSRSPVAFGFAVLLLAALAAAHVTVFLVLGLTIGLFALGLLALAWMHESPPRSETDWRLLIETIGMGATAAVLGILQGGVFVAIGGEGVGGAFQFFGGLGVALGPALLYYVATFGVPGALGVVGGVSGLRDRSHASLLLVLVATIGFAAPHLVWASASPIDNFKFFTLASIALGLLAGPGLETFLARLPRMAKPVLACVVVGTSVATPLLHTAARLMTAPSYLLAVETREDFGRMRLQPLPAERFPAEHAASLWLREHMHEGDLLLLVPPVPSVRGRAASELDMHGMTGVFSAAPSHPGYPGIRLPRQITTPRVRLHALAQALRRPGLCGLAPLWIYARESLLQAERVEAIRVAAERGLLRPAMEWQTLDGRHSIYEACPDRIDPMPPLPGARSRPDARESS